MKKLLWLNLFIPILTTLFFILEVVKVNGERLLSVKYRLWMFDYGSIFLIIQALILVATFFIWKDRKYRIIAFSIFLIWLAIGFLIPNNAGVYD